MQATLLVFCSVDAMQRGKQLMCLQVLHTRSCSGVGMHFLHFLTACYLVFSLEHQSIAAALASLPPLKTSVALQLGTRPCHSGRAPGAGPLRT